LNMRVNTSQGAVVATRFLVKADSETGPVSQDALRERKDRDGSARNPGSSAIRVAPLLTVSGAAGHRAVVVGRCLVAVDGSGQCALEITAVAVWVEHSATGCFRLLDVEAEPDRELHCKALERLCSELPSSLKDGTETDLEHRAARYAKALAEGSRNAVAELREIRYELERQLAEDSSAGHSVHSEHTSIVSSLVQLNIICGRAADEAREAVREGLWVHITDSHAYHAYRRLQDPSIINEVEPANADTRPWMRLHDAGMRQCLNMRKQLDAESATIRALLSSAASISSSREADAQARFNTLAAVLSLGLGVPALILALYGADMILPLNTPPRVSAFIPVAVGMVVAAVIAVWRAPRGKARAVWWTGAGAILLVLGLLVFAGMVAPK
jgi:hypothetical protein